MLCLAHLCFLGACFYNGKFSNIVEPVEVAGTIIQSGSNLEVPEDLLTVCGQLNFSA
jgi:hypothetical protein